MFELDDMKNQFAAKLFEQINTFGVNRNNFEIEIEPNKESWILQLSGHFNAGYENGNLKVWEIEIKAIFSFIDFEAILGEMYIDEIKKYITE